MGKFGKILAVFGVLTIGAVVVAKTTKKAKERHYSSVNDSVAEHKDEPISDRLKAAATKKVIDILSWTAEHEKEFKGITITLETAGAAIGVIFAVRKGMKSDKILKKLDDIKENVWINGFHDCFEETKKAVREAAEGKVPFTLLDENGDVLAKYMVQEVAA